MTQQHHYIQKELNTFTVFLAETLGNDCRHTCSSASAAGAISILYTLQALQGCKVVDSQAFELSALDSCKIVGNPYVAASAAGGVASSQRSWQYRIAVPMVLFRLGKLPLRYC